MIPLTKEESDVFIKDYGDLVKKHGIDFACYPVFVPDGAGGFKVVIQNTPVRQNAEKTEGASPK